MQVSKEEILHIANLARLNLEENEIEKYIENLEDILNFANIVNNAPIDGLDVTIGANEAKNVFRKDEIEVFEDYSKKENITNELKVIGFYLTSHPVSKYLSNYSVNSMNYKKYFDKNIKLVIMIDSIRETTTKNNDVMAFIKGSDGYGQIDFTIFPLVYKKFNNINNGDVVEVFGKVEKRFDRYQIIINNINRLE